MGARISAGLAIAWTGYRGSTFSLTVVGAWLKKAGDNKGLFGGLDSPIWCIVGCLPVINGLSGGCPAATGRGLLTCIGAG